MIKYEYKFYCSLNIHLNFFKNQNERDKCEHIIEKKDSRVF